MKLMKMLVLSCNTGEGHNSCAGAVKQEMERRGGSCDIVNALALISESASTFVCGWHNRFYRYMPRLYGSGYDFSMEHPHLFDEKKIGRLLRPGVKRLNELLATGNYDMMLCVHVFPAVMAAELRRNGQAALPTGFLATDYTCSPTVEDADPDYFFIPHDDLKREFIQRGVPANKIVSTGIPVRKEFQCAADTLAKSKARTEFGIGQNGKNILLMCGSMGCGPMEELVQSLVKTIGEGNSLSVVCGSNKRLYESLIQKKADNLHLFGYTDRVPQLMDAADLMITKPGGISITEAGCKRLPMLLVGAVGGCEERNRAFFTQHGWAQTCKTPEQIAALAAQLIQNPQKLDDMQQKLNGFEKYAAEKICNMLADPDLLPNRSIYA